MSFPRNNLSVTVIDLPIDELTQKARVIFLPLKRASAYTKQFGIWKKSKKQIFIRFSSIPERVRLKLNFLECILRANLFTYFSTSRSKTNNFSICVQDLPPAPEIFDMMRHLKKNKIKKWIKIIKRIEKWNVEDNVALKQTVFLCSILLSFCFSEKMLKKQLRMCE